jgi:heterodisulfide reductase subunit C
MTEVATQAIRIEECDLNFVNEIIEAGGEKANICFQCGTCSGGCPTTFAMDYTPRQIMRMVQLGMRDEVLSSATIWLCASCNTCTTRCPRGVELTEVMAAIKSIAIRENVKAKIKEGPVFYKSMVEIIEKYGRMYEPGLMLKLALKSGGIKGLLKDASLGIAMFKKGKLGILPTKIRHAKDLKAMIKRIEEIERRGQ